MESEENKEPKEAVARGLHSECEVVDLQAAKTRRGGGSKKGRSAPWMQGNSFAWRSGFYSSAFTAEELEERNTFECQAVADLGGDVPAGKRALLKVVSLQYAMICRCDRAITSGTYIPQEHLIALMNSFRLNLNALGLERKAGPEGSLQEYLNRKAAH